MYIINDNKTYIKNYNITDETFFIVNSILFLNNLLASDKLNTRLILLIQYFSITTALSSLIWYEHSIVINNTFEYN